MDFYRKKIGLKLMASVNKFLVYESAGLEGRELKNIEILLKR